MGQLTQIAWSAVSSTYFNWGGDTITYSYSGTQNNGQITQMSDSLSGETVTYQYDALKRLTSACSSLNNCATAPTTFQYDGFGNLTQKTLAGTAIPVPVNGATNQLTNASYDANGNMFSGAGVSMTYDAANRVVSASPTSGGTEYYGYAPDNKRVWRLTAAGAEEWTMYGAKGEKLGVFRWSGLLEHFDNQGNWTNDTAGFSTLRVSLWFDGKLISENGPVMMDRLGTNKVTGARFYPYGEEITSTAGDRTKFATYNRDSLTGLDYADQRFYASGYGRFNTVDPLQSSAKPNNPGSWNRFAYVGGDPVNLLDPHGMEQVDCGDGWIGDPSLSGPCCLPGNHFLPDPTVDPACYDQQGGGGAGLSNPPPPQCDIEFGYAPAFSPKIPGKHTFFYVDDGSGQSEVVDAGPTTYPGISFVKNPPIKVGPITIPRPPTIQVRGFGNLQTNVSPTGLYNEAANPASVATFESAEPCSLVAQLEQDARNLNNIVPYSAPSFGGGWYNSNSFTYTLAVELGLPIPNPTVYAPGWGNYIPH